MNKEKIITLKFPFEPKAKQSFKYAKNGIKYQSKDVVMFENNMKAVTISQLSKNFKVIKSPVHITYRFYYEFPKRTPKRIVNSNNVCYKYTRPDIDNLQKAVNDALKNTVICDDSIIVSSEAIKLYSEQSSIEVDVEIIDNTNYF